MATVKFFFNRPLTHQQLYVGERPVLEVPEHEYDPTTGPRLGLVISTYDATPFIQLSLEIRRRLYPWLPVLVHDDASPAQDALQRVCEKYGAELEINSIRLAHEMGDLSAVVGGLSWAAERGVDLLVKMSRRFIPMTDWTAGLKQLAVTTQQFLFGQPCQPYRLPLRTECMALAVRPWTDERVLPELGRTMLNHYSGMIIENEIFERARTVRLLRCAAARNWEEANQCQEMITAWPWLSGDRHEMTDRYLWHNFASPAAYAKLASVLNLNYGAGDFDRFDSFKGR
jgi:hypothetical protein